MDDSKIKSPFARCDNNKLLATNTVIEHLVEMRFTRNYYDCDHYNVKRRPTQLDRQIHAF